MNLNFSKPLLMGILNLTPDSFSDGGKYTKGEDATLRIHKIIQDGADIIDIGAESTFGAEAQVTAEEEWNRLELVLSQIDFEQIFVSLDTSKADIAERGLKLGVQMINDVTALRGDKQMLNVLLKYEPYVCLMYSADETAYATRTNHHYDDVIQTVSDFLKKQSNLLIQAGFPQEKIIIDPGLGFFLSSDPAVSWEVIDRLGELKKLGFPILIGPSMKSFLGGEISDRGPASVDAAKKCIQNTANIVRVHDVKAHQNICLR
jgi:dihydropteroate synthase